MVVVSRTMAVGPRYGLLTSFGIVCGDYVYIAVALLGLTALSDNAGKVFALIPYIGAVYLLYLGLALIFASQNAEFKQTRGRRNHLASFFAGFLTTIGNPKAILFYLSLFPALIDLSHLTRWDVVWVYCIVTVTIFSVMSAYVYLTHKAGKTLHQSRYARPVRVVAGLLLIGSAALMIIKR